MKRIYFKHTTLQVFLLIKFILAFCSIVYELVLAQALSAFLENTVLRYSTTIGLYIFCLGIGSLLARGRFAKHPIKTLIAIETVLTFFGGLSLGWFFVMDALKLGRIEFLLLSHFLIIIIGILTGFETPLLMTEARKTYKNSEGIILAFDYAGAFAGSVLFAFVFYPLVGLVPTALFAGMLNALVGILLFFKYGQFELNPLQASLFYFRLQLFLLVFIVICLIYSGKINHYLINLYLS